MHARSGTCAGGLARISFPCSANDSDNNKQLRPSRRDRGFLSLPLLFLSLETRGRHLTPRRADKLAAICTSPRCRCGLPIGPGSQRPGNGQEYWHGARYRAPYMGRRQIAARYSTPTPETPESRSEEKATGYLQPSRRRFSRRPNPRRWSSDA